MPLILPKQHFADVCALDRDIAAKVPSSGCQDWLCDEEISLDARDSIWFRIMEKQPGRLFSISTCM